MGIILTQRSYKPRWAFVLALAAILGALRYTLAQLHFDQTSLATRSANDQQKTVVVESLVVGEPDAREGSRRQPTQATLTIASTSLARVSIPSCHARA